MSEVDDRVVAMKFDNASFEQKLGDTLKSLDQLQKSLDFSNSKKGLQELTGAAKNFDLSGITQGIEGVSAKFLALSTVAVTVISEIVSRAAEAGARVVKAFSLDPIMDGFREYETNIGSIQTILANTSSKGTGLSQVNKALDELNTYSDQTIYNFAEMTRNIGTFTAAGVDLDTSTASIKGIANLAAISGSSSMQASSAMYQLSQAIASGTVKLIDWNSVVNAGMGGEVFQKALFESGKAMKTLTNVPVGQTFDQWKKAGNTFRGSLESGWLTTEVLTKTLKGFTGDLSEAQIMAMGYTKQQAAEMLKMGKIGKDAATEVKTFTQLISTVKEAVGSGWSSSFRLIIGDFNQAKKLFTTISNGIGGIVQRSADARNKVLEGWNTKGGRVLLIDSFMKALKNLETIIKPIRQAFREFFPRTTANDLMKMTREFSVLVGKLKIGSETAKEVKRVFRGVFAAVQIGWTVFKELGKLIGGLIGDLRHALAGTLGFAAGVGDSLVNLNKKLVAGGGIHDFFLKLDDILHNPMKYIDQLRDKIVGYFDAIVAKIKDPLQFLTDLKDKIVELFEKTPGTEAVEGGIGRVSQRFGDLLTLVDKVKEGIGVLKDAFSKVADILPRVWTEIHDWFAGLGKRISEIMKPGDFETSLDAINVGLLGGIIILFKNFVKNGPDIGGIFDKARKTLDAFRDQAKMMQQEIKAKVLLEIAAAIALLAASLTVLSLIDSEALTRAMVAVTIGMAQLVIVMKELDKMANGIFQVGEIVALAVAMNLISAALVTMAGALKLISSIDAKDLAKGLAATTFMLTELTVAIKLMTSDPKGLITGSAAMIAMATALNIMAGAVKLFGMMDMDTLTRGFGAVAAGLAIMIAATHLMPDGPWLVAQGAGMIAISTAMVILAGAVEAFGLIPYETMKKGLTGIAAGLLVIAGAMSLMPATLPLTAAGVLILSGALVIMAGAIAAMGLLDVKTLARGVGALGAMLLILAVAVTSMSGAVTGAIAIVTVAGALTVLAAVVKTLGDMDIKKLAIGIGAMLAIFASIGLATLVLSAILPEMLALGAALLLVGAGFALLGLGAMALAKAFQIVGESGAKGAQGLLDATKILIRALPEMFGQIAVSLYGMLEDLLQIIPMLIRVVSVFLDQFLETVIKDVPKFAKAIAVIISNTVTLIHDKAPDLIELGFFILTQFLKGLRDHIEEIATLVIDIITKFSDTLTNNAQKIVDAGVGVLLAFTKAIADRAGDIVTSGTDLLVKFLEGITNNLGKVSAAMADIVTTVIKEIGVNATKLAGAGTDALIHFLGGVTADTEKIARTAVTLITSLMTEIGKNALTVTNAAADVLITFLNGLAETIRTKAPEIRKAGGNIASAILEGLSLGLGGGKNSTVSSAVALAGGMIQAFANTIDSHSPSRVFQWLGEMMTKGLVLAFDRDKTAPNSAVTMAEGIVSAFQKTLDLIPDSLAGMDAFNPTITPVLDLTGVQKASGQIAGFMNVPAISPEVSYSRARTLSYETRQDEPGTVDSTPETVPQTINFTQNNNSPKALAVNDVYRATASQIALAKEKLGIK